MNKNVIATVLCLTLGVCRGNAASVENTNTAEKTLRLDSIITIFTDIAYPNSMALCQKKAVFTYDNAGRPLKFSSLFWNLSTGEKEGEGVLCYEWDEDGRISSEWYYSIGIFSGGSSRTDYEYNTLGQKEKETTWRIDWKLKEWVEKEQTIYRYDSQGNNQSYCLYRYSDGTWLKEDSVRILYDEQSRHTGGESYEWTGTEWVPKFEKLNRVYDDAGRMVLIRRYKWQEDTKTWFNYSYTEWEYDDSGAELAEHEFLIDASGRIIPVSAVETVFVPIDNGGQEKRIERYTYDASGASRTLVELTSEVYDRSGCLLKRLKSRLSDGIWRYKSEAVYTYDADGRRLTEDIWSYTDDADNKRWASISYQTVYDAVGNVVEKYRRDGVGADEWENALKETYAYENGSVETEYRRYLWKGDRYELKSYKDLRYDFDVPSDQILQWPYTDVHDHLLDFDTDDNPYKVLESRVSPGYFEDLAETSRFYYSELLPNGVSGVEDSDAFQLKSSAVTDYLEIEGEGEANVRVYNLQGVLMLTSSEKMVSVEHLADGVYVVDLNGSRTKIVKR